MTNNPSDHAAVEVFLKSWGVYQEIIRHNYMFHREISAATRTALEDEALGKTLRILDLGCGDASMALPLLTQEQITSYKGCDLSKPALDIAKKSLATLSIPHRLICDDMLRFMTEQTDGSADLVLASYAIHHLNANDKQRLIREISRVLSPDGRFILIDIFREPDESRIDYITHYMTTLKNTWIKLSEAAQTLVVNHASEFDFPEQTDFYETACLKNGFLPGVKLAKHTWHQAWLFSKSI